MGGGDADLISFTFDESLAQDYAKDMITLASISRGTVTPSNIEKYLDKHDKSPELKILPSKVLLSLEGKEKSIEDVIIYDGLLEDLKRGQILDKKDICYHIKEMTREECLPVARVLGMLCLN